MSATWVAFDLAGWGALSAQGAASVTTGGAVAAVAARGARGSVVVARAGSVVAVGHKSALSIRPE